MATTSTSLEHTTLDFASALSVITGVPAEDLLAKQWSISDLQEITQGYGRIFSAVSDRSKGGFIHGVTMSETEPSTR